MNDPKAAPPYESIVLRILWMLVFALVWQVAQFLLGALVVHGGNGWMFSNANGGWEFPAFWAVAQVILALLGDGAAALWPSIRRTRRMP